MNQKEIKFRAWSPVHKVMTESWTIPQLAADEPFDWHKESILMQYTGLKDRNGLDIYEGDIMHGDWQEKGVYQWVEYQAPSYVMKHKTKSGLTSQSWSTFDLHPKENQLYSIVGNIYENTELLQGE